MTELLVKVVFLFLFTTNVDGKTLPDLLWNSSNNFFNATTATVKVDLFDELTIICPFFDVHQNSGQEFSKIYMVSDMAYLNCQLDSSAELFLACEEPSKRRDRKIVFRPYSPLPNGLEFAAGKSYYLISTSNGTLSGINSRQNGLCVTSNLRLRIDVLASAPPTFGPVIQNSQIENFPEFPREPLLVQVSEHYNGDEDEIGAFKSTESRSIKPPLNRVASPLNEAVNRHLNPDHFSYVLNLAQQGAVGSVSFSDRQNADLESPKPAEEHQSAKFRSAVSFTTENQPVDATHSQPTVVFVVDSQTQELFGERKSTSDLLRPSWTALCACLLCCLVLL